MKRIFTLVFLLAVLGAGAQSNCEQSMQQVKKLLDSKQFYKDYSTLFHDILPCAEAGNSGAQNYIGLMYSYGLGIEKNESIGFNYVEKSALNGEPAGQSNLGNFYRKGTGCTIDMKKAVEWYTKAADKNHDRASYGLGYMYLKGLGVTQDYDKAVEWFKKSNYGMAKHWLGVCYYLGYGVPQDTEKALEYLYGNNTPNSVAFLQNVKTEKRDQVLNLAEKAISEAGNGDKKIEAELIAESRESLIRDEAEDQKLNAGNILGEWTGRFIEYDWSGKTPLRILPLEIVFSKNKRGDLSTRIHFENKTFENTALLKNNTLIVSGFTFKLDQLYPHDFKNDRLTYEVLGMNISSKIYNNTPYLLIDVDSYIDYWREPGTPITLVLRPKNDAVSAEDEALFLALAAQKTEFIKVFPVPFNEQLYVAFDLKEPAKVQLQLISVTTGQTQKVAAASLEAGNQSFTVDTANLPKGFYVVQVHENDKLHSRTIIKQ
ncbi:T9SS type A sorting domain-containing protein [Flavobacterium gelatinilyticum]|uniref:T9SS type A sorting domain-containing protein n=1 Tax=Flavobacterium gelatinilyticum TaxID=3003260 RepID=UPI0024808049|nr:T9SS type A sorting domain-containing protein [Flavobacterium gelatinilyticum]